MTRCPQHHGGEDARDDRWQARAARGRAAADRKRAADNRESATVHAAELDREIAGLQEALKTRLAIGQAEGLLMAQFHLDADAAFRLLVKLSQEGHTKLRLIAERIVCLHERQDAATTKVVLGGLAHADDLSRISRLAGDVDDQVHTRSYGPAGPAGSVSPRRLPALPVERLRTLPVGQAIVLARRTPPVQAVLTPWWAGPHAEQIRAALDQTTPLLPHGHGSAA